MPALLLLLASGQLAAQPGLVFTNRHVIEGAEDFAIELLEDPNELPISRFRASLVGYSMDVDFALLRIDRNDSGEPIDPERADLPYLSSMAEDARRGDEIFVFGYPGIGEGYLAFTAGTVTTIRNGTMSEQRIPVWYQTDAQIAPGNSGGLAVNASGEMVGIPTSVLTEQRTGGRLGGILAVNAVQAALDGGLETDTARIASATSAPVIEGGELDFGFAPSFGSADLAPGFAPNPHTVSIVSGGEVAVGYLGRSCTGYAAEGPDYRLNWKGSTAELRFFFSGDDGGDTTLIVNMPDGSWVCGDDADGTLDPLIALADPPEGQYDIWVGSFDAGAYVSGMLNVTELGIGPASVGSSELNYSASPYFGSIELAAGFRPDPSVTRISAGGNVDVAYLGRGCVGHAAAAPDLRLRWSGTSEALRIFFRSDEADDTALVINLPDGSWSCKDDSETLDPLITIADPQDGQYDIWVATYASGQMIPGKLSISELDLRP